MDWDIVQIVPEKPEENESLWYDPRRLPFALNVVEISSEGVGTGNGRTAAKFMGPGLTDGTSEYQ